MDICVVKPIELVDNKKVRMRCSSMLVSVCKVKCMSKRVFKFLSKYHWKQAQYKLPYN